MAIDASGGRQVSFTRMDESTPEDIALIVAESKVFLNDRLPDTMIEMLEALRGPTLGYQVDRYEHSLQTATRGDERCANGSRGRGPDARHRRRHRAGESLRARRCHRGALPRCGGYLGRQAHGVFQGYHYWDRLGLDPNTRERYRDSPYFDTCAHFCAEWDQVSFDPDYDTLPIDTFVPLLREVFTRPASGFGSD